MFIPDPDPDFFSIPDPGSRTPDETTPKKEEGRKIVLLPFL
jgi:hypothetical protein